ncbi:hypothetical protein [Variovorax sp. YR216]|uniref:hypothetical protein n=1 Tax=Variovorax sp. YR216 TaxID=1882828 RepID=UPI00089B6B70|nr:hypothetical protein [Variovorax sp. YR216]SEA46105.1 hypothetical protein SAMN05444680_102498 [Variovorax sp. YR216]
MAHPTCAPAHPQDPNPFLRVIRELEAMKRRSEEQLTSLHELRSLVIRTRDESRQDPPAD